MTQRDSKPTKSACEAAERLLNTVDPEVWVVTSGAKKRRGGLLATWVNQVSLAPQRPVLLLGIAPNHHTAQIIDESGAAAAHLLQLEQAGVGLDFADGSGRDRDKFEGVSLDEGASNHAAAPILDACYGWVAGEVFARLDAGDRIFYWLRITAAAQFGGSGPLRQSQLMAQATSEQKQRLRADREGDCHIQLPWQQAWAKLVAAGDAGVHWPPATQQDFDANA